MILAIVILSAKCFAHVHIEFEPPPGTWESFEKEDQKRAYEKSQDAEKCEHMSDKEKVDAYLYEKDHTA